MNIKTQILLDKFLAKPSAYLLNFVVRVIGKILTINHSLDREFKTIAICKYKGMGSIIQSTPMLCAIRKRYPKARIFYISTKSNKKILEKIQWIDSLILIDDSNIVKFIVSNTKALLFLIKIRPQVYLDLEIYSDYSTLFTLFSLSVNRIGFYLRSSSFRMGIYTHMMFFNTRVPISKAYLQLALLIGCDIEKAVLYPLEPLEVNNKKLTKNEYIVINPNASDLRLERRWDRENYIALINLILKNFTNLDIFLIGSKAEQTYTQKISDEINNKRVVNTAGLTTIDDLIFLIKNAKFVISNDTGPMHIAFCTQTPIICLFGPCSPEQYGLSKFSYVIYNKIYCSPCVHDFEIPPCKGDNICMKLITVSDVYEKLVELIENKTELIQNNTTEFIFKTKDNILGKVNR